MKKVRVGIIGTGGIANGRHIPELLACDGAEIVALCDVNETSLRASAERIGIKSDKCYADYRDLITDSEVDAVDICTPNYLHAEMAIAALRAGKPVSLEKPVALTCDEARSIIQAENESSAFGMTCFTYRFMAAARYAKTIVKSGIIGDVIGLNVAYLKNSAFWEGRRLEWRFQKDKAGSGVVGDLGVHLIDLAQLLVGNIRELCATKLIVVKERITLDGNSTGSVTTDDSCSFLARFESGAEGSFHITRCAIGHHNTIRYDVYGLKGSISFDLTDPSHIFVCTGEGDPRNYKTEKIKVPEEYYLTQAQCFINAINGEYDFVFPSLSDGEQGQRVIDAILRSADDRCWVEV